LNWFTFVDWSTIESEFIYLKFAFFDQDWLSSISIINKNTKVRIAFRMVMMMKTHLYKMIVSFSDPSKDQHEWKTKKTGNYIQSDSGKECQYRIYTFNEKDFDNGFNLVYDSTCPCWLRKWFFFILTRVVTIIDELDTTITNKRERERKKKKKSKAMTLVRLRFFLRQCWW